MTLFSNTYRVESSRLKGWDYTSSAPYYITLCTQNMTKFFGKIEKGKVNQSVEGSIVEEEWLTTAKLRNYILLDEYIVMPNHFHGIIAILKDHKDLNGETTHRVVSTKTTLKPHSLGSIIGQFKSKCTKRIREFNKNFEWQSRFHDRIIRNEKELNAVREYIKYNPLKWSKDEFYS